METSPIPEGLLKAFDATVMVLNELTAEAADLKAKFGERSKLYKAKAAQVETLREFYKQSKDYAERSIKTVTRLGVDLVGAEVALMQVQHGLTFRQASEALGYKFSEEFIKAQDLVDDLIKKATEITRDK